MKNGLLKSMNEICLLVNVLEYAVCHRRLCSKSKRELILRGHYLSSYALSFSLSDLVDLLTNISPSLIKAACTATQSPMQHDRGQPRNQGPSHVSSDFPTLELSKLWST